MFLISKYVQRHKRFAFAMRRVSPSIKIVGVGALHVPVDADPSSDGGGGGDGADGGVSASAAAATVRLDRQGAWGFHSSWTGRTMKDLLVDHHHHTTFTNSSSSSSGGGSGGGSGTITTHAVTSSSSSSFAPHSLQAISEHFYIDSEKPTAAQHAKQASDEECDGRSCHACMYTWYVLNGCLLLPHRVDQCFLLLYFEVFFFCLI